MAGMTRIPRTVILAALSALLCVALVPAVAGAKGKKSTVKVRGGTTTVTLNAATAAVLTGTGEGQLGLKLGVRKPARANLPAVSFPITRGTAVVGGHPLALMGGHIRHVGGLSLSKGGASLRLRNFWINVDKGILSARVAGVGRVPILKLGGNIKLRVAGRHVRVSGVTLTFTPQAIGALNATFGTRLDTAASIPFGTAVVRTRIR